MNRDSQSVRDALRWLQFSEEDLDAALYLKSKPRSSSRHVCWHSQQAAEKALKAALVLEGTPFPRTHDLDTLRNLLPKGWAVRDTNDDLADLTQWAEESRYPGDWDEPSHDDAAKAESEARSVCNSVIAEFKRRGISGRQ